MYDGTAGLFEYIKEAGKNTYLYVGEGAVGWGPRVRLFSYPEIAVITLRNPDIFESEKGSDEYKGFEDAKKLRIGQLCVWPSAILTPLSVLICLYRSRKWRKTEEDKD